MDLCPIGPLLCMVGTRANFSIYNLSEQGTSDTNEEVCVFEYFFSC